MKILSVREGIEFETVLESDTSPLSGLVEAAAERLLNARSAPYDPTRVKAWPAALNELATASGVGVRMSQSAIPLRPEVHAACEMLGLDPLYVANEGKLIAVAPAEDAAAALHAMHAHPLGAATLSRSPRSSRIIPGLVVMRSVIGGDRVVSMLTGEQLPRIC